MNRWDQREAIFRDEEDRRRFLSTLGEVCLKTEWQIHAMGSTSNGADRREIGVQKAERIVREELERVGWTDQDQAARPKGHRGKVRVACRLRDETTMGLKWIAQRLHMGGWTYVFNLLNEKPGTPTTRRSLLLCR